MSIPQKIKRLPVQVIETTDGVILKRGCTAVNITGNQVVESIKSILAATANDGATPEEIYDLFDFSSRPVAKKLLEHLLAKRLLVSTEFEDTTEETPEGHLDVFYWHFGKQAVRVSERLNKRRFVVLGINHISRRMAPSFAASCFHNFLVVDHPLMRNLRLFDEKGKLKRGEWPSSLPTPQRLSDDLELDSNTCLVVTADFGYHEIMHQLNSLCVKCNSDFMPVILQNLIGFVGPLVVPGKTACFECLRSRQNSHMRNFKAKRIIENLAFDGQSVVGFHPSMASILGDIAVFELLRFYGDILPEESVACLLEFSVLARKLISRKVLRVPRCIVCGPKSQYNHSNYRKKPIFSSSEPSQSLDNEKSPIQQSGNIGDYLVDNHVGILSHLKELPREQGDPDFFYFSAITCDTSALTRHETSGAPGGTGVSVEKDSAKNKAISEAVERYCPVLFEIGNHPLASFETAGLPCISPGDFALFSRKQYERDGFPFVPFEKNTLLRWAPTIDLRTGETWYVPAVMIFLPYFCDKGNGEVAIAPPISTGLACHIIPAQAAISAICEVIERDAFTITWQAMMGRPRISIESLSDFNRDLIRRLECTGGSVVLLNITMDNGVPAILSSMRSSEPKAPTLLFGAAAHLNPEIAVRKSLEELAQAWKYAKGVMLDASSDKPHSDWDSVASQESHANVYCHRENVHFANFLFRSDLEVAFGDIENLTTGDTDCDLETLVYKVHKTHHRVLLADITTEDIRDLGLTVVRAVIPGFHPLFIGHRVRALGGRRLWEIPQQLGYHGIAPESGDNPAPHPFS